MLKTIKKHFYSQLEAEVMRSKLSAVQCWRLEYVNASDQTKSSTMDEQTKKRLLFLARHISISVLVDDEELV